MFITCTRCFRRSQRWSQSDPCKRCAFVWCFNLGRHFEMTNWLVISRWDPRLRHQTNMQRSWVERCLQISRRMWTHLRGERQTLRMVKIAFGVRLLSVLPIVIWMRRAATWKLDDQSEMINSDVLNSQKYPLQYLAKAYRAYVKSENLGNCPKGRSQSKNGGECFAPFLCIKFALDYSGIGRGT